MKTYIIPERLTKEERECNLIYSEIDEKWYAEVSIGRLKTKFVKQGWTQTSETTLSDGTWVSSTFEAPYWAIGVKSPNKRIRSMTDEQRKKLSDRAKARFKK